MSRNKEVDRLEARLDALGIPAGGMLSDIPVTRALEVLERNDNLIVKLQAERDAAVAQHTKLDAMWRESRAKYNVANMQLGDMRQRMIDIEMSRL